VSERVLAALAALVLTLVWAPPAQADEVRDKSWHLGQLKVADAHKVTRGAGVTVAVVDTGVDADHPDLRGAVLRGVDLIDPDNEQGGQRDVVGHGTSVASLIAGRGHGPDRRDGVLGIAPEARILPINVYDERAKGAAEGAIARGIRLAVDQGADVICVAFAGGFERGDVTAVEYATSRGILVIAGVGNSPAVFVQDPAGISDAVAVTAVDRDGKLATTVRGAPDREIDIAAPGADIQAALPDGKYYSGTGTSAATAIVAGAAALIKARYPDASRNEQLQRLVWTTAEAGEPGRDFEYGWGVLNLVDALTTEPRVPPSPSAAGNGTRPPVAAPVDSGSNAAAGLAIVGVGVLCLAAVVLGIVLAIRASRRRTARV
jgi:type VII secretion-associated serine protease mycosin